MKSIEQITAEKELGISLTPELQAEICTYVRESVKPKKAAYVCGVPEELFDVWMASVPSFRNAIKKAEAKAEADIIRQMHVAAANGNRYNGQYLLQNRYMLGSTDSVAAEVMSKIITALQKELPKTTYERVLRILRKIKF
jgi:hypothetical protein